MADKPWFAPEKREEGMFARARGSILSAIDANTKPSAFLRIGVLTNGILGLFVLLLSVAFFARTFNGSMSTFMQLAWILMLAAGVSIGLWLLIRQFGVVANFVSANRLPEDSFIVGIKSLMQSLQVERPQDRRPPAPELALGYFVQQVRTYAQEKSYQKNRIKLDQDAAARAASGKSDGLDLLKRRWDEVVDSLGQLELYLANDPQQLIEKLTSQCPVQKIDVSKVFREVAEGFDTTWRRKGINIESAIVTPLKANTHDVLLRRVLVGPWRASAFLASKGHGVIFSAKAEEGIVVARWECGGFNPPEGFLNLIMNREMNLNERIEKGMSMLLITEGGVPSASLLNGLISLVTFVDFAQASKTNFQFKQNESGFVIELRLS